MQVSSCNSRMRILMTHAGEAGNYTGRSGWDPLQGTAMKHIFYWWSSKRLTSYDTAHSACASVRRTSPVIRLPRKEWYLTFLQHCWVYGNNETQLTLARNKAPGKEARGTERAVKQTVRHKCIHTYIHTYIQPQREESQIDVIWKSKTQRSLGTWEQFRRKIDFQIEWERIFGAS